jgi:LPS-assembly protein
LLRRSDRIGRTGCLLLLFACLAAADAGARAFDSDLPFEVVAQRIDYDGDRQLLVAEGQVRLLQEGNRLRADWVAFNRATGQGVASGHVVLEEDNSVLEAAFIEFAIDSTRGFVLTGHYDTGPGGFIVRASQLTRTGTDTYDVSDASFTTCRCPDDEAREPWQIEAEETDLRVGVYAVSKNAKLSVLDVPIISTSAAATGSMSDCPSSGQPWKT